MFGFCFAKIQRLTITCRQYKKTCRFLEKENSAKLLYDSYLYFFKHPNYVDSM
ncbi:hypothetical protein GCWU000325_00809 [Alloprevotella tannerae ATCC 51259]|uniref:Uncharacterized protein n=1 Tax=Alloprevotella tannerae ATCC 51259 TaxID=626522 RepID=C9LF29_9BACT|nr:hypothetical protein GCWU000325_00809 [Alloprevotella tannerae ATCC 51259]